MRTIHDHGTNTANRALTIEVLDEPGDGNACHHYAISGWHGLNNPSADASCRDDTITHILFQHGPIPEAGVNGVTIEALLAIIIDRLRGFQFGRFACDENAHALASAEESLAWLKHRTLERERRGVEGTHKT